MPVSFEQLPAEVRQAILSANTHTNEGDYEDTAFGLASAQGQQGLWAVPSLCYDFHESNYSVLYVNLQVVSTLDLGPAMAEIVTKVDPGKPAWIVVDPDGGDTDFQIIECV